MGRLKTFAKYVLWVIGLYIFTMVCTYVGFNSTYKNIINKENLPNQITIDVAQSTKVNGRIYGKVTSNDENNLNGKYIKVQIYTKNGNLAGTKYLKIENTNLNEPKKFMVNFTAENIKYYTIEIVDNTKEVEDDIKLVDEIFGDIFTNEELKTYAIVTLVLFLMVI